MIDRPLYNRAGFKRGGSRQPGMEHAVNKAARERLVRNIRERGYDTPSDRQPGIDISSSPQRQQFLQEGITSLQSEMADRRRRGETGQDVTDYLRIHALNQPEKWGRGFGPDPSFF